MEKGGYVKVGNTKLSAYFDARHPEMSNIVCTYNPVTIASNVDGSDDDDYYDDDYNDDYNDDYDDDDDYGGNADTTKSKSYPPYCYAQLGSQICLPAIVPYNQTCLNCESYDNCKKTPGCKPTDSPCYYLQLFGACVYDPSFEYLPYLSKNYSQTDLYEKIQRAAYEAEMDGVVSSMEVWCPGCIIYTYLAYDEQSLKNFDINQYRYQLAPSNRSNINGELQSNYGHCEDSFTIPQSSWSKLINSPPAPLVKEYYECVKKENDVVSDAFGIATANSYALGTPLLAVFVMCLFMMNSQLKIINIARDIENKLVMRREVKKMHIENKLYEIDPEYRKAFDANKVTTEKFHDLDSAFE